MANALGADGSNYVAGLRFLCGDPQCVRQPAPVPSPPPAPPVPPPVAPPVITGAPNVSETAWFGPKQGPSDSGGLCPCGTFLQQFALFAGPSGAPAGITGYCAGPGDGVPLELFPIPAGVALSNGSFSPTGFTNITGTYGPQFVARCGAWARMQVPACQGSLQICLHALDGTPATSVHRAPLLPPAAWTAPARLGRRPSTSAAQQASRSSAST